MKRFALLVLAAPLLFGPGERTIAAQTAPANPAVSRRNIALSGGVWPGDFNGDGITDLAAGKQVVLGNGDATFGAPIGLGYDGGVMGTGDFNNDGKLDVVALQNGLSPHEVVIVFGNGDGTFGSHLVVTTISDIPFVLSADLDGDGNRDLVIGSEETGVTVYPNRGTGTFIEAITLPSGIFPHDGVITDLNGDGKRDIAIANRFSSVVSVYLNQGAFVFTEVDVAADFSANDVTAADLNGDDKPDLVVVTAKGGDGDTFFTEGNVLVLFGRGDGTFGPPTSYAVARGGWQVVVDDFNRDGIADIATANRSSLDNSDNPCPDRFAYWDSVSILPGNGNGTFQPASSFSIGIGEQFQNTVTTLNTSDLNGDHAKDLIVSNGALLLNRQAAPNAPPVANAGPDQTVENSFETRLFAIDSMDSDDDMLTFRWIDNSGEQQFIRPFPAPCVQASSFGPHTYTLIADDGHGHQTSDTVTVNYISTVPPDVSVTAPVQGEVVVQAVPYTIKFVTSVSHNPIARIDVLSSADRGVNLTPIAECTGLPPSATQCRWNSPGPRTETAVVVVRATDSMGRVGEGSSGTFSIRPTATGPLPSGWSHFDVGAVGAPGSDSFDNGVFTVTGSGADIWGTADAFHYVMKSLSGNFEATVRVDSVQNVNAWTKAGIMIRETIGPGSRHVSIFATPGKGVAFQRRLTTNGISTHTAGPLIAAPLWLRLVRMGTSVCGWYRKNTTDGWTLLACETFPTDLASLNVGLAVTSHVTNTTATAKFSNVRAESFPVFTGTGVGDQTGTVTFDGTNFKVTSRGADIWGTSDQFFFTHTSLTGDGSVVARVRSLTNTHVWAKAGVMIRDTIETNSKYVDMVVTPGKGVAMQYRPQTGGLSFMQTQIAGTAPAWVSLSRQGTTFTARFSNDGVTWTTGSTVQVTMGQTVLIGLAVTSHNTTASTTAVFDDLAIVKR